MTLDNISSVLHRHEGWQIPVGLLATFSHLSWMGLDWVGSLGRLGYREPYGGNKKPSSEKVKLVYFPTFLFRVRFLDIN